MINTNHPKEKHLYKQIIQTQTIQRKNTFTTPLQTQTIQRKNTFTSILHLYKHNPSKKLQTYYNDK